MASSFNLGSSSNSTQVKILWDYENLWVPDEYDLTTLRANIQTSLSKAGLNLSVGKVKAFGPDGGSKHSKLIRHPEHFEVISLPDLNKTCDGVKDNVRCDAGIVTGSTSELILRKTDIVGKYLMLDMICESRDNTTLLIITGDEEFAELIKDLKSIFQSLRILVALLPNSTKALRSCCYTAWIWRTEENDGDPNVMINGGGPLECKKDSLRERNVFDTSCIGRWDFKPADLSISEESCIHIWHGKEDKVVPFQLQRCILQKQPLINYHEIPQGGHLIVHYDGIYDLILRSLLLREEQQKAV